MDILRIRASAVPNFERFESSSPKASRHLRSIRSSDTKAEHLLRSELWKMGFRFRKNYSSLPSKPDIVFIRERIAIFCDGDFWHGKNWSKDRERLRKGPNAPYWLAKISSNMKRDRLRERQLRQLGWEVIRAWESSICSDAEAEARRIGRCIFRKRKG
jgi:DNA mismatch endonuclease, patch repair protein